MPHITTSMITAGAFILFAIAAVVGLVAWIISIIAPRIQDITGGMSFGDYMSSVMDRIRHRHRNDDDEDEDDEDGDDIDDMTAALLTMMSAAPIIVDDTDEVVRANPDAYRLGVVDDDAIVNTRIAHAIQEVRKSGETTTFEMTTMTPHRFANDYADQNNTVSVVSVSRPNWLRVTVGKLSDNLVVILLDDISESVRFMHTRDDFIANVSEQLSQPSADLTRLVDLTETEYRSPEQVQKVIHAVRRTVNYINHMVSDLQLLIQAQEQITPNEQNRLYIFEEVSQTAQLLEPQAQERHQHIRVQGDDSLVVHGESSQIRAALGKLLDNALKYSPDNATVTVDVRQGKEQDAVIRVIDRGSGIPVKEQERIFERFYRGSQQNERTSDGSGLGLSIVKHVALTHHGSVQVWSKPDQGSTFTLILPLEPQAKSDEDA